MSSAVPAISGFFGFCVLVCAYSAQYWAKKCHEELKEIKDELKRRT